MKTLIRILLLIAFLSMTAFAQDAKLNPLVVDSRMYRLQELLAQTRNQLVVTIERLYLANNQLDIKTQENLIRNNNQLFISLGRSQLVRELPPNLKEYEVPLKEVNETD